MINTKSDQLTFRKETEQHVDIRNVQSNPAEDKQLRTENFKMWQKNKLNQQSTEKYVQKMVEELYKKEQELLQNNEKLLDEQRKAQFNELLRRARLNDEHKQADKIEEDLQKAREKQNKMLRQVLADESFQCWKEEANKRILKLPRNGYQFFEEKPKLVVHQEWVNCLQTEDPQPDSNLIFERDLAKLQVPRLHLGKLTFVPWCRQRFSSGTGSWRESRSTISSSRESFCSTAVPTPKSTSRTFTKEPAVTKMDKKKPPFR